MDPPAEQTCCGQEIPEPAMKAAIFSKLDRVSRERPEMQIMRPASGQTDESPHPAGDGRDSVSLESLFIFRLSLSPSLFVREERANTTTTTAIEKKIARVESDRLSQNQLKSLDHDRARASASKEQSLRLRPCQDWQRPKLNRNKVDHLHSVWIKLAFKLGIQSSASSLEPFRGVSLPTG